MAALGTAVRARALSLEMKTLLFIFVISVLVFSVVYPFLLLILTSFNTAEIHEPNRYGLAHWRFALSDPNMLGALWNSITTTVARQVIAFPIAIVVAWLIARTNMPGGKSLEFFFWIAFFLPGIPVVQAWILLAEPTTGVLNRAFALLPFVSDRGPFNIFSFWGIVWVHLVSNTISVKVMLMTPSFRNMDAALEDASRIAGAGSLRTLFRVTVPVMMPIITTLALISTLRAFQSFEVELILGTPIRFFVFGNKIFTLLRDEPPEFGAASALSIMILLVMVPLILLHRYYAVRRKYTTLSGQYQPQVLDLRKWKWPAFSAVFSLAMLMTVIPGVFLLMGTFMKLWGHFDIPSGSWTLDNWNVVLQDRVFMRSLRNTLYMSFGSATLALFMATMVAYIVVRIQSRLRATVDFLIWVPYALPGIVLSLAWLTILLETAWLRPLYGTLFALILVSGLSGLTTQTQITKANLLQMGTDLEDASTVSGAGFFRTMRLIVLPLLAPVLVLVWVLEFVGSAGNAVIPAILATPASRPLSLLQLEHIQSGWQEKAAVVGVILLFLTVGVAIVARTVGFRLGLERGNRRIRAADTVAPM